MPPSLPRSTVIAGSAPSSVGQTGDYRSPLPVEVKEEVAEEGEAGDGEQAIALARQLNPDLVVMDVKMPVMDGITAAETIAEERIAPIVMLTAFSQRELVDRARRG